MLIRVFADQPADFDRWLAEESQPALEVPSASEGKADILAQSCINCHSIRGTPAAGTYAPDLTHLMRRQTLAAGMIENTPQNLTAWVRNPQDVKPGCLMPAFGLDDEQLDLIVEYLLTLH